MHFDASILITCLYLVHRSYSAWCTWMHSSPFICVDIVLLATRTHDVTYMADTWCYLPPHSASLYLRDCQHVLKLKLRHLDSGSESESEWHKLIMPLVGGQSLKRPLSPSIFGRLAQKSNVFAFLASKNYNLAKNTILA